MALFGFGKKTDKELMKENERALRKVGRDLDREQHKLTSEEKKLEMEIRKAAKDGNNDVVKLLAKQLVQMRKAKTRTYAAKGKVQTVGTTAKVMQANSTMANAMATTTKTMGKMNDQMKPQQIMKTMQEFEKENQMMSMKEELIDDTLNSVLDESGDEEEQDAVVSQVLDEIGIEITGKLVNAPAPGRSELTSAKAKITDSDIEAQLAKLKM